MCVCAYVDVCICVWFYVCVCAFVHLCICALYVRARRRVLVYLMGQTLHLCNGSEADASKTRGYFDKAK